MGNAEYMGAKKEKKKVSTNKKEVQWKVGETCFAQWTDEKYYNAVIRKVLGNNQYKVEYTEYQDVVDVPAEKLSRFPGGQKKKHKKKQGSISEKHGEMKALSEGNAENYDGNPEKAK